MTNIVDRESKELVGYGTCIQHYRVKRKGSLLLKKKHKRPTIIRKIHIWVKSECQVSIEVDKKQYKEYTVTRTANSCLNIRIPVAKGSTFTIRMLSKGYVDCVTVFDCPPDDLYRREHRAEVPVY